MAKKTTALTNFGDWEIEKNELPKIIYGGENACCNDDFDTRNKFVMLVDCYDFPPVFKIQSLDGTKEIDRCFPLYYRLATHLEVERITNPDFND
jgi:hypothetical protein